MKNIDKQQHRGLLEKIEERKERFEVFQYTLTPGGLF